MTQTPEGRLRNASIILAGLLADPSTDLTWADYTREAWKHLQYLEAYPATDLNAPEPVIKESLTTAERVEPSEQEWKDAAYNTTLYGSQYAKFCREVSAEAYRLAAERAGK